MATASTTDDAGGVTGGVVRTATSYTGSGMDAVYGLATDQVTDPTGLNLDTKTAYETPSASTYLRVSTQAAPSASLGTPAETRTTTYYGGSETVTGNPCVTGTSAPQAGLPKTITDPAPATGFAITHAYVYDSAGRVVASQIVSDGATNWTCTTYDARGRITGVAYPAVNGAAARTVTYAYAVNGNPLIGAVSDPVGTVTTTVDLLGRVASCTDVKGTVTGTTYDQVGRVMTTMTTTHAAASGTGPTVSTSTQGWTYLDDGRVSTVSVDGLTVAQVGYDTTAEVTGVAYPATTGAGTTTGGNGAQSSISRDNQGRQRQVLYVLPGSHGVQDTVTYSQAGRVTSDTTITDTGPVSTWTYAYDPAARLTSAVLAARAPAPQVTYAYGYAGTGGCGGDTGAGLNGSRVSSTITPAGGAAVASAYCTDYAGRVSAITGANAASSTFNSHGDATSQGGQTFTYDSTDRTVSGTATKGGVTQTFTYTLDTTGRLISRSGSGSGTGVDTSTSSYSYTADGDSADIQLTATNQIGERYFPLPGGVLYTKRYAATGGDLWGLPNLHGDTITTTTSTGVMVGQCAVYDPYGTPLNPATGLADTTAATTGTPNTRTGTLTDAWEGSHQRGYEHANGANWTLMGARTYQPTLGTFTSTDPIYGGNTTTYGYPNDPINTNDLDGQRALLGRGGGDRGKPETISAAEEKATANQKAGKPYNRDLYNSGLRKRNKNQKLAGTRNANKDRGQPNKMNGLIVGGAAVAGVGGGLWWMAKLAAPACGPFVLVCAAVF